ncbi:hypothetical protein DFA_01313 [Cavenderia fasciculata]|uniref:CUE domain-containing protein n=1 Tax=Cavenderia fasciculata TaxID=261658 RepID=F4PS46_CACFS|nr:uncharacterized protein DFA_01313 [Cavenderia fasciculata]EGG21429.1 hypothetical protein DFA_01313 [Cavenderia fasciculata]|eukprot:XP_004359279.1 hypothetical protein DFA_01313 [Cavenderia fasciculata]
MEGKLSTIRVMFPNVTSEHALDALKSSNWNIDQTVDLLLAEIEAAEMERREKVVATRKQDIVYPPPPPPPVTNACLDEESERILNEFLLMEKQQQQQQHVSIPAFVPPAVAVSVPAIANMPVESDKWSQVPAVVPPATAASVIPAKLAPISTPVVVPQRLVPSIAIKEEAISLPEPLVAQRIDQEQLESAQRDITLLQSISNTLRELENEIKSINFLGGVKEESEQEVAKLEHNIDQVIANQEKYGGDSLDNDMANHKKPNEIVIHHHCLEGEEEEKREMPKKLVEDIERAIEQMESYFNVSLERTEKALKSIKEEIDSWKIKDNVLRVGGTIKREFDDIISSITRYINPIVTEEQKKERAEKKISLENRLQQLRSRNKQMEEERMAAIAIATNSAVLVAPVVAEPAPVVTVSQPAPTVSIQPPSMVQASSLPQGYYYYNVNQPNVYYFQPNPLPNAQ